MNLQRLKSQRLRYSYNNDFYSAHSSDLEDEQDLLKNDLFDTLAKPKKEEDIKPKEITIYDIENNDDNKHTKMYFDSIQQQISKHYLNQPYQQYNSKTEFKPLEYQTYKQLEQEEEKEKEKEKEKQIEKEKEKVKLQKLQEILNQSHSPQKKRQKKLNYETNENVKRLAKRNQETSEDYFDRLIKSIKKDNGQNKRVKKYPIPQEDLLDVDILLNSYLIFTKIYQQPTSKFDKSFITSHDIKDNTKKKKNQKEFTITSRQIKSQLVPTIQQVYAKRYLNDVVSYQIMYEEYVGKHWIPTVHLKSQQMPQILEFEKLRYVQTFNQIKEQDYTWISYRIDNKSFNKTVLDN